MRSFFFKSISLLSQTERKARKLPFVPSANAIIGGNHRGKSTILRMLFYPLGCATHKLGPQWIPDTTAVVTFVVDGVKYRALRSGNVMALFASDRSIIWAGIDQGEYRNIIAAILHFNLQLTSQQGVARLARISYFFCLRRSTRWQLGVALVNVPGSRLEPMFTRPSHRHSSIAREVELSRSRESGQILERSILEDAARVGCVGENSVSNKRGIHQDRIVKQILIMTARD